MSWPLSLLVALLAGAVALVAAGFVANLCVGWYGISSFEGGSGYFVVGMALLGGIVGAIVGLVAARQVDGFGPALGIAGGVVLGVAALVGGGARLLADVPPTIDDRGLVLDVEVMWPASHAERPVAPSPAREPRLEIGALSGNVQRVSESGPLWLDDARLVDGRWVAPGAVDLFTNRGRRTIAVYLGDTAVAGVLIPLRGPERKDTAWSEWMPHPRPGAPPLPDGYRLRYRVAFADAPRRSETLGGLEVVTHAHSFSRTRVGERDVIGAYARFELRHRGRPVALGDGAVTEVAALAAAPRPALVARVEGDGESRCVLVVDDGGAARVDSVGACQGLSTLHELTNDPARYARSKALPLVPGRLDRGALDGARYMMPGVVLDAAALAVRHYSADDAAVNGYQPPLLVSPDGRSFARLTYVDGDERAPALAVTDVVADSVYRVPVDRARTRMPKFDHLSPEWAAHYFAWARDAAGVDRLTARADAPPLAYRGRVETGADGNAYYWLEPARAGLRDALVQFLVRDLGAERLPPPDYGDDVVLRVLGVPVTVSFNDSDQYVAVFPQHGVKDTTAAPAIARRFDAELATGKHDALFGSW